MVFRFIRPILAVIALALAGGLILPGCESAVSQEERSRFHYQAATGKCLNAAGEEGHNPYDSAAIHGSKRAECVKRDANTKLPFDGCADSTPAEVHCWK